MREETLKFYNYKPEKKPQFKGKYCSAPFENIQIDEDGDVMLCGCQLHMPYVVGNIYKESLQEIWLNKLSDQVRRSVLDQDFTYCNWDCSALPMLPDRPEILPELGNFPRLIKIDLDRSCNLKCPSCRENIIIEKNSPKIEKQISLYNEIIKWCYDNPIKKLTILPLSSGEIFASHSGLNFLKSLVDYPYTNIELFLSTNGTLLFRNRSILEKIKNSIKLVAISIDAATSETYSVVRGGDWNELMKGIELITQLCPGKLHFNFCVQEKNFKEIEAIAEFVTKYDSHITFQPLGDWGHWNQNWWAENNVLNPSHRNFTLAIDNLKKVIARYPKKIMLGSGLHNLLKEHP